MNAVSRLFTLICLLGLCLVLGGQPAQAQRSESFAQTPTGAENFVEVNFDYFTDATRSVTWGDYDGDGDLDLAVGNGFWLSSGPSNNVTVYENVGGVLKFDPANGLGWQTYEYYVMSVAWGDYDGDGDLDLAVGKLLGDNKVYENVGGDQKFIQGWQSGNSGFTNCVAWGDYDGDGDLDLATGNGYYYGGNDQPIKVYENISGTLQFDPAHGLGWQSAESAQTNSLAWGDYDGDGDLDLVAGNYDSQPNRVYENVAGTFYLTPTLGLGWQAADSSSTNSVAWGDYDGDGDLDLAVGNYGQPNKVYENISGTLHLTPTLGIGWQSAADERTWSLVWGDYDGDGDLDLAVGNYNQPNKVYENVGGTEPFVLAWQSTKGDYTASVAWGDYDSDGDLDLVAGNGGDNNRPNMLYENVSSTLLQFDPANGLGWQSTDSDATTSVAWGDYDGDGDLDLAVENYNQPNKVYENVAGTLYLTPILGLGWQSADSDATTSVAWGDYDGDGDLDLAVGNYGQPNKVYENISGTLHLTPTLGIGWQSTDSDQTNSIAWGDYDGDGDLDLAVGNDDWAAGHHNQVYENVDGDLQFDPANGLGWQSADSNNAVTTSVAWGDYDGDGDLDLAAGESIGSFEFNRVYENVGGNLPFFLGWQAAYRDVTHSLAWGDYDGDGDLDLAVGNDDSPNKVYENIGGSLQFDPANGVGWRSDDSDAIYSVAWGDYDGDGDLDLAAGCRDCPNRVYKNVGGNLKFNLGWQSADSEAATSLVWGDYDGDGDLDLAVGNYGQPNKVYENVSHTTTRPAISIHGLSSPAPTYNGGLTSALDPAAGYALSWIRENGTIPLTYTLLDSGNHPLINVSAQYSLDGGGSWQPALPTSSTETTGLASGPSGGVITPTANITAPLPIPDPGVFTATLLVKPDYIIGDLEVGLSISHTNNADLEVYLRSPDGVQIQLFNAVGGAGHGFINTWLDDQAVTAIISGTAPFTGYYRPQGSLAAFNGQASRGVWQLIVRDSTSSNTGSLLAWELRLTTHNTHLFTWDVFGSHFFGQSDNVVVRLIAQPDLHPRRNGAAGPFQRAAVSTVTFPVRVRGNQVRVMYNGNAAEGAVVYRIRPGQSSGSPYADLAGQPYTTDWRGYLPGNGEISLNDQLAALWQVPKASNTFDGVDDYIDIPIDVSETDYALSLWFKTTCTNCGLFSVDASELGSAGYDRQLYLNGGQLCARVYSDETICTSGAAYADGQWHHVAHTYGNGVGQQLYVDGVLGVSGIITGSDFTWQTGVNLGFSNGAAKAYFDGLIEEVRIYNQALTQTAVTLLATGGEPPSTNLDGYWPLDEVGGSIAHDQSGHGHDGAIQGATEQGTAPYTLYYTSAAPNETGLDTRIITQTGVQTLTVSITNTLILFDLDVSLEWDARYDAAYLETLQYNFQRASEILFDWTNGQAALGRVTIYHDRQHWDDAEIRIYATNRLRPNANQGGVTPILMTDPYTTTITYAPGQVRMGAVWNRYGEPGSSLGDDWPRTLVHELGHYLLYLDDNYLGLTPGGQVIPVSGCPGAMSDPYRQDTAYDEFHTDVAWVDECAQTLSNRATGRSDWATIRTFYPDLASYQNSGNLGPATLPLEVTHISFVAPVYPSSALVDPTFYLTGPSSARYLPERGARAFLFQTVSGVDQLVDLGSPVLDHVLARGARQGDRLCVFETAAARLGCETINANDEQLALASMPTWQPDITVTPVTSRTIEVAVTAPATLTLQARLFPAAGAPGAPITLTVSGSTHGGVFYTVDPALAGYVQVWVDEPGLRREAITDYALGGSPGLRVVGSGAFQRSRLAPAMSADGQVVLYGNLNFSDGEFYALQEITRFPSPLAWATPIGPAYHLTASTGAPTLEQASLSLSYLPVDVPPGEEEWIRGYFWNGVEWRVLPTTLNTYENSASVPAQGEGVYALMSSYQIGLFPTWNLFSYPVSGALSVTQALASIQGNFGPVYTYDPNDPIDPWKLYDPSVPPWVNDLWELSFGQGYWITITHNITTTKGITLYLKGAYADPSLLRPETSLAPPPATFYGILDGSLALQPGETITAWVNGVYCGRGRTLSVGDQVGYVVQVFSDLQTPGCGASGRAVSFRLGEARLPTSGYWDSDRPIRLDFYDLFKLYLPLAFQR